MKRYYARSLLYTLIVSSALSVLFFIAPISYVASYYYYIPHGTFSIPVYLDYSGRFGAYDLFSCENIIDARQTVDYFVELKLTLPRTPNNIRLGNFMTRTSVLSEKELLTSQPHGTNLLRYSSPQRRKWPLQIDEKEELKKSIKKPMILPHRSLLTQTLDTLFTYPFYYIGWRPDMDHEVVKEKVLNSYEQSHNKEKNIVVELDRTVNVAKAELIFNVKWTGIRYLMHHYKLSMFIIGTMFFWTIENIVAGLVVLLIVYLFSSSGNGKKLNDLYDPSDDSTTELIKPQQTAEKVYESERNKRKENSELSINDIEVHDPSRLLVGSHMIPFSANDDNISSVPPSSIVLQSSSSAGPRFQEPTPVPESDNDNDSDIEITPTSSEQSLFSARWRRHLNTAKTTPFDDVQEESDNNKDDDSNDDNDNNKINKKE